MATTRPSRKRSALTAGGLLLGVLATGLAVYEFVFWLNHVYDPNARVQADFTVLASPQNATVRQIHVARGDRVTRGMRLATFDTEVVELEAALLDAERAVHEAAHAEAVAELELFRRHIEARIATETESIRLAQAQLEALRGRIRLAENEVERSVKLMDRGAASQLRHDTARDRLLEHTTEARRLQATIGIHRAKIEELEAEQLREPALRARIAAIERRLQQNAVAVQQAKLRVAKTHIYSPIDGIVDEIYVRNGKYLEHNDNVFLLHDPAALWIEAHVAESDIRHVRVGQRVRVEFDAYPFRRFRGTVAAIGRVTQDALAADAERSGSVAGVQRIPVTIEMVGMDRPMWPGMRAAVNIVIE